MCPPRCLQHARHRLFAPKGFRGSQARRSPSLSRDLTRWPLYKILVNHDGHRLTSIAAPLSHSLCPSPEGASAPTASTVSPASLPVHLVRFCRSRFFLRSDDSSLNHTSVPPSYHPRPLLLEKPSQRKNSKERENGYAGLHIFCWPEQRSMSWIRSTTRQV